MSKRAKIDLWFLGFIEETKKYSITKYFKCLYLPEQIVVKERIPNLSKYYNICKYFEKINICTDNAVDNDISYKSFRILFDDTQPIRRDLMEYIRIKNTPYNKLDFMYKFAKIYTENMKRFLKRKGYSDWWKMHYENALITYSFGNVCLSCNIFYFSNSLDSYYMAFHPLIFSLFKLQLYYEDMVTVFHKSSKPYQRKQNYNDVYLNDTILFNRFFNFSIKAKDLIDYYSYIIDNELKNNSLDILPYPYLLEFSEEQIDRLKSNNFEISIRYLLKYLKNNKFNIKRNSIFKFENKLYDLWLDSEFNSFEQDSYKNRDFSNYDIIKFFLRISILLCHKFLFDVLKIINIDELEDEIKTSMLIKLDKTQSIYREKRKDTEMYLYILSWFDHQSKDRNNRIKVFFCLLNEFGRRKLFNKADEHFIDLFQSKESLEMPELTKIYQEEKDKTKTEIISTSSDFVVKIPLKPIKNMEKPKTEIILSDSDIIKLLSQYIKSNVLEKLFENPKNQSILKNIETKISESMNLIQKIDKKLADLELEIIKERNKDIKNIYSFDIYSKIKTRFEQISRSTKNFTESVRQIDKILDYLSKIDINKRIDKEIEKLQTLK
ncbi:MAG: hypothetical protein ACTSQE_13070 [Candidatus Heimdallarchaeaceae archaeon]